jgi:hypothetical protein
MTRYRAVVATKELLQVPTRKGVALRQFTDKTLTDLMKSSPGRPISLGFRGMTLSHIHRAILEDDKLFVEFEADDIDNLIEDKYVVPGFRVTSSRGTDFVTVRCMDYALTDQPLDKTLDRVEVIYG